MTATSWENLWQGRKDIDKTLADRDMMEILSEMWVHGERER